MHPAQRRRPTIAKEWQLAVLRKLHAETRNPTDEQRSAAAAETGLDEKWVRNWFSRQRSKLAARNSRGRLAATVPIFKFQHPLIGVPTRRSVSTPTDPAPYLPSPASLGSPSNTQTTSRSHRSVSAPISLNNPIPTYSRDPLCNRYPDFSQFFRPGVHERFTFELSASISNPNHPVQFLANPAHLYPHDLATDQRCSTDLPVAFSMRLVDLLTHSPLARYPVFPAPHRI
ncbi:hypothetical protein OG21DRAFT_1498958 [Imleria badia]|nr:hypothetical protein OG21DRAFT_1498958 [Imleria badia]